jgi:uncharacterized damage-inducible protein DinB
MSEDLRFPIGKFSWPAGMSADERERYIARIAAAPARLRAAVAGLSDQQLDTPYRDGGWTVRQVVHHVPDSHMNSYTRFKLALTEDEPTIKPYDEAAWAKLSDSVKTPLETSLSLLESLHERWVTLMRLMSDTDWKRRFVHPEHGPVSLERNVALYAWHGDHHVGHVTALRKREGWV